MTLTRTKIVIAVIVVFAINLSLFITGVNAVNKLTFDDNSVYMICDVYDVVTDGNHVLVDIKLPNGQLLTKQLSIDADLPEEFEEVVIQTSDLDDYSTYKIVGMR